MNLVYIVVGLALAQFLFFGISVGRARGLFNVPAPATTGNEMFERYFRVQMNTLELLVVLIPALPMFAYYISEKWAAALGAVYLVGRVVYFVSYVKDPKKRELGFTLSILPAMILLIGGVGGAIMALFRGV
jgi:uncharacterized membrane protein YecN with MAPEG domain